MGLGAIVHKDDPVAESSAAEDHVPDVPLKRSFPGLGRIADAIKRFEDVLRDFVTMADPDTSKKVTRILQQVREVEPSGKVTARLP